MLGLMKDTELLDKLRLIRTSHIGPITCQHLLKRYGTVRDVSINAARLAEKLATEIGQQNFAVISGLARGIDAAAHKGALKSGTIAVLANGIDEVYPLKMPHFMTVSANRVC